MPTESHPIHKTYTDEEGHIYRVVADWWVRLITFMVSVILIVLLIMAYVALSNRQQILETQEFNDATKQRNQAIDEMLINRAQIQRWTYQQACNYAKSQGQLCLENPNWWANPEKYPLLKNNPSGTGLFPPQENAK